MKILLTLFVFLPRIVLSQEVFNFSPDHPRTLDEVKEFESSLNSESKGFSHFKPYFDEDFEDMVLEVEPIALIFERKADDFIPKLATWYFFNADSLVTGFFYSWAFYNPVFNPTVNKELLESQKGRLKEYQAKFREVEATLIEFLGDSDKIKVLSKSKKHYIKQAIWDEQKFRTVLTLDYSPELVEIPGTEFIAGGDSKIIVKTFYKQH